MNVLDAYSTTKNKVFRALSGEGGGAVGLSSGSWYNTAAMTSIQFLPDDEVPFITRTKSR